MEVEDKGKEKIANWVLNFKNPWWSQVAESSWKSTMAQGQIISVLARAFQTKQDSCYLQAANMALNTFRYDFCDGGLMLEQNGEIYFEEVFCEPPAHILNGFVYTLFGLYDLYRITKEPFALRLFQSGITTLKNNLLDYDLNHWSSYDDKDVHWAGWASPYYQSVHINQMKILYTITGIDIFSKMADKWKIQLYSNKSKVYYFVARNYFRFKRKILGKPKLVPICQTN